MKPAIAIAVLAAAGVTTAQDEQAELQIAELIGKLQGDLPEGWSEELLSVCKPSRASARLAIDGLANVVRETPPANLPTLLRVTGDLSPFYGEGVFDKVVEDVIHPIENDLRPMEAETRMAILTEIFRTRELIFLDGLGTVQSLAKFLEHSSSHVREEAADLLGERGTEALPSLKALGSALESEHPTVDRPRGFTLMGNGRIRTVDQEPVSHDLQVRTSVARAMLRIAPDDPSTRSAHVFLLAHGEAEERRAAAMALAHLGPDSEALAELITALNDPDPILVREVITAIGMMGPEARDAIPTLEQYTGQDDPQIAERAKAALRQIRG